MRFVSVLLLLRGFRMRILLLLTWIGAVARSDVIGASSSFTGFCALVSDAATTVVIFVRVDFVRVADWVCHYCRTKMTTKQNAVDDDDDDNDDAKKTDVSVY